MCTVRSSPVASRSRPSSVHPDHNARSLGIHCVTRRPVFPSETMTGAGIVRLSACISSVATSPPSGDTSIAMTGSSSLPDFVVTLADATSSVATYLSPPPVSNCLPSALKAAASGSSRNSVFASAARRCARRRDAPPCRRPPQRGGCRRARMRAPRFRRPGAAARRASAPRPRRRSESVRPTGAIASRDAVVGKRERARVEAQSKMRLLRSRRGLPDAVCAIEVARDERAPVRRDRHAI